MQKLLLKIYGYRIFSELMLLYPLYNVMFADRGGLSTFEISSLLMIWSLIILIVEIPSGALADKYSRRMLLGVAQLIRAVGYGFWVFMPTYIGFMIGLALWGVAEACTSGAFEALVYDELKSMRVESRYTKVIGQSESIAMFVGLGATLAASPVFFWLGYPGILWGSIAAVIISSGFAFSLPSSRRWKDVESPRYREILKDAAKEVAHNTYLLKLLVFGVFVGMLFRIFDEYASLIITASSVKIGWVPVVSACVFLPVILIGFVAHRLEKLQGATFTVMLGLAGVSLALMGAFLRIEALVLFSLFLLLVKASEIVFGARLQHGIQGHTRATITSISSFGVEVTAIGAYLIYGVLTQIGGTALALEMFGLGALALAIVYLLFSQLRTWTRAA